MKPIEILLVEDNPGDVLLTKEAFNEGKIKNSIHVARDGEEALDFLYKRNGFEDAITPDMILLDLNLPRKDGKEVLEEIKGSEALCSIPVVILTSSSAETDIVRSYKLHANSYVVKPIDLSQFAEIVNAIEDFWFSIVILPSSD